jgi:hypothetical protein
MPTAPKPDDQVTGKPSPARSGEGVTTSPGDAGGRAAKKAGGNKMLIVGCLLLLVGGGLLSFCLCGGGGFVYYWFWWRTAPPDEIRYLPTGTINIQNKRVDQIRSSSLYKEFGKDIGSGEFDVLEKQFGIAADKIDFVLTGHNKNGETVTVVRTKSSIKDADIKGNLKGDFKEEKSGKNTIWEPKAGGGVPHSLCVVDSKVVLYGQTKVLKSVLERDKAPEFSTAMQTAMKKADFSKSETHVLDVSDNKDAKFNTFVGGTKAGGLESEITEIDVGSSLTMRGTAIYKDSSSASDAKKELDEGLEKAKKDPGFKEVASDVSFSVSSSGNAVSIEMRVSGSAIKKKQGKLF